MREIKFRAWDEGKMFPVNTMGMQSGNMKAKTTKSTKKEIYSCGGCFMEKKPEKPTSGALCEQQSGSPLQYPLTPTDSYFFCRYR